MAVVVLLAILRTIPVLLLALLLVVLLQLRLERNFASGCLVSPGMNSGSPRRRSLHVSRLFCYYVHYYVRYYVFTTCPMYCVY